MKIIIDNVPITFNLQDHSYSYPVTATLEQISQFFNNEDFNLLRDFTCAHYNKMNNITDYYYDYSKLYTQCLERFPEYLYKIK